MACSSKLLKVSLVASQCTCSNHQAAPPPIAATATQLSTSPLGLINQLPHHHINQRLSVTTLAITVATATASSCCCCNRLVLHRPRVLCKPGINSFPPLIHFPALAAPRRKPHPTTLHHCPYPLPRVTSRASLQSHWLAKPTPRRD